MVNQVGTVTGTLEATDPFEALRTATSGGQIKTGGPAQGEWIATCNHLLVIEPGEVLCHGLTG